MHMRVTVGSPCRTLQALGLEEAAEQLAPVGRVRYVQLQSGTACLQGAVADLGGTTVCRSGVDCNRIARVETLPGRATLLIPVRGAARLGTALHLSADSVVFAPRATELDLLLDRHFVGVWIAVDLDGLRQALADRKLSLRTSDTEVAVLQLPADRIGSLDRVVQEMLIPGTEFSGPASSARAALMERMVFRMAANLLGHHGLRASACEHTSRTRAVQRAREFVDAHLDQPLSLTRISRASYASPRALEYGFREVLALSPMAYVRCARLSRVRHELRRVEPRQKAITHLAMKWGFWHLGQFSSDYRAFFGELPSQTLARARGAGLCEVAVAQN